MRKNLYCNNTRQKKAAGLLSFFMLLRCFIFCNDISAKRIFKEGCQSASNKIVDTFIEKQVDYIEQIYFSGKNKEGLTALILATTQTMEKQQATTAVIKQYTFLSGIKDKAEAAKNSCDVLELLAAGIYSIDANEAILQNISKPTEKAKANAGDALAGITSLSSTTSNMAMSTWLLSGGKIGGLGATTKIMGTAGAIGGTAQTLVQGTQALTQGANLLKGFGFGGGDKPCKSVPQKSVEIGVHIAPTAPNSGVASSGVTSGHPNNTNSTIQNNAAGSAGIKITIKNVTYNQHSAIALGLEKVSGISAVNSDDFNSNTGNLLVTSTMRTKEIVDKIIQSNPSINFVIESTSTAGANLSIKSKSH